MIAMILGCDDDEIGSPCLSVFVTIASSRYTASSPCSVANTGTKSSRGTRRNASRPRSSATPGPSTSRRAGGAGGGGGGGGGLPGPKPLTLRSADETAPGPRAPLARPPPHARLGAAAEARRGGRLRGVPPRRRAPLPRGGGARLPAARGVLPGTAGHARPGARRPRAHPRAAGRAGARRPARGARPAGGTGAVRAAAGGRARRAAGGTRHGAAARRARMGNRERGAERDDPGVAGG